MSAEYEPASVHVSTWGSPPKAGELLIRRAYVPTKSWLVWRVQADGRWSRVADCPTVDGAEAARRLLMVDS